MSEYQFADWLKTHAKTKTIMEKLERSLVPFQLFSYIDFYTLNCGDSAEIELNGNTYRYLLKSKTVVNERDVYLFKLGKVNINNTWEDILMGYSDFKVVTHNGEVVTIYPYQEEYFSRIIELFEAKQYTELYRMKSEYMKNLLARYILLKLINKHKSYMSLLYSVRVDGEVIPVLAGVEQKECIMYAFSRKEANELARHHRGKCKRLTVIYFINSNFEKEDKNRNFAATDVEVISIKQFYRGLKLSIKERCMIEKQIFFLIEMLYDNRLEWDVVKLKRDIMHAPKLTDKKPRWMEVPKMLVEDALNVLVEDYNNPTDIFHMLCAANLVNSYTNRYKEKKRMALKARKKHSVNIRAERATLDKRVHIMYCFKRQVMETIISLVTRKSKYIKVAFAHIFGSAEYTLLVNIKIEGHDYQFKFRGVHARHIAQLHKLGVKDNGEYSPIRLQPVAPALYLYSCHLKWE